MCFEKQTKPTEIITNDGFFPLDELEGCMSREDFFFKTFIILITYLNNTAKLCRKIIIIHAATFMLNSVLENGRYKIACSLLVCP